jgi:hypothetical protein
MRQVLLTALEVLGVLASLAAAVLPADRDVPRWVVEQLGDFASGIVDALNTGRRTPPRPGIAPSSALWASDWVSDKG